MTSKLCRRFARSVESGDFGATMSDTTMNGDLAGGCSGVPIKNMAQAWVMILRAAMIIAGSLYVIFRQVF